MDFGDILFFIIFIIVIVSNVFKQLKKARQQSSGGEAAVKKPGWRSALEQILEEARKQMEGQGQSETPGTPASSPSGWEGILPEKQTEIRLPEERPRPVTVKPVPPQPMNIQLKKSKPVAAAKDYYAVVEDKKNPQQLSQEALRNAVVWAEILAPPVGLRGME